jgi:hypothetical protein
MKSHVVPSIFLPVLATLALSGCEEGSNGDGSSVTLTAPTIVGPNSTTPLTDNQPVLTVANASASNGSTPTYTFQVASDSGFGSIAAQASGVAQGASQTSWEVTQPLANGSYFWRARADLSGVSGPFSAAAQLAILGVGGPGETIVLQDDLTNGSTISIERGGGTFTSSGWRVDDNDDFLRYEVDPIPHGYVQWQNLGLTPQGIANSRMIFGMWDPTAGKFRENPFRVNLQHNWPPDHNPPWLRLRWISEDRQQDGGNNFNAWDPSQLYTWRIEWGPDGEEQLARVLLDGVELIRLPYRFSYQPNVHWMELGILERRESVINLVYRNFTVVRRQ